MDKYHPVFVAKRSSASLLGLDGLHVLGTHGSGDYKRRATILGSDLGAFRATPR